MIPRSHPASGPLRRDPAKRRADNLRRLREHDEDLAYLAQLTCVGLKPLSRYERPLNDGLRAELVALGLVQRTCRRRTEEGGEVDETVFSRHTPLLEIYRQAFDGGPLRLSRELGMLEGYLFGFPPCCVSAYLARPYAPNGLDREEQAILFHWACSGCSITPLLLPRYREALAAVREA
ncbi:MAG: hypothetical protein H6711_06560 [Myxococcales bacterium]|nr:hypothetical protein [Myxococcales bacterium]